MDHTVKNKHFPGVFEATPLRAPVRPWGHAPRQANPILTQGRRGAQGRDTPPPPRDIFLKIVIVKPFSLYQSIELWRKIMIWIADFVKRIFEFFTVSKF